MNEAPSGGGQGGFTIIETLIVIAVSGLLLLSAMLLIVGQQNKVQFTQSIQEIQSAIQQTMSEVGTGYYSNPGNMRCEGTSGNLRITSGNREQGANTGCIFIGKVMQFGVRDTDPQNYIVHSVAGLQDIGANITGQRPLDDADPTVIAPGSTTNNTGNFPNASRAGRLLYGLQAVSMTYTKDGVKRPIGAVAFVSSLGNYQDSELLSGNQQVMLVPVGNSDRGSVPLSTIPEQVVDDINNNLADPDKSPVNPNGGVQICFASAGTEQSGLVTLGSNGRSLTVKLDIKSTRNCT